MGTVIKYPQARGRHEASQRGNGASAVIIILPVVRIERMAEAPPGMKAAPAELIEKSSTKSTAGRKNKRATPPPAWGSGSQSIAICTAPSAGRRWRRASDWARARARGQQSAR
jgi:hypothetical protein